MSCGLPLGKNCPWSIPAQTPSFFTLSTPSSNLIFDSSRLTYLAPGVKYIRFFISRDWTQNMPAWIAGPHPTSSSVGPITQIIFPFPKPSYVKLVNQLNSSELADFVSSVFSKSGSVTTFPNAVDHAPIDAIAHNVSTSTRAGNVGGITGYYVYSKELWQDSTDLFIPARMVDLMPRLADGSIEYSFYGSEAYCKIHHWHF